MSPGARGHVSRRTLKTYMYVTDTDMYVCNRYYKITPSKTKTKLSQAYAHVRAQEQ